MIGRLSSFLDTVYLGRVNVFRALNTLYGGMRKRKIGLERETIRNRPVIGSNPIGGSLKTVVFPSYYRVSGRENHYVFE